MPLSLSITAGLTLSRNSRLSAPGTDREPVKGRDAYLVDGHVSSSYQSLGSRAKAHRQGWGLVSSHSKYLHTERIHILILVFAIQRANLHAEEEESNSRVQDRSTSMQRLGQLGSNTKASYSLSPV